MSPEQEELIKKITKMVLNEQIVWVSCQLGVDLDELIELVWVLENE